MRVGGDRVLIFFSPEALRCIVAELQLTARYTQRFVFSVSSKESFGIPTELQPPPGCAQCSWYQPLLYHSNGPTVTGECEVHRISKMEASATSVQGCDARRGP